MLCPRAARGNIYYVNIAYRFDEHDEDPYPVEGPYLLTLTDGRLVPVREINSGDARALQRLFGRLSERTIELRYFGPMKQLSDAQARRFAEVDGVERFALVALDPDDEDEVIAVVRYDRSESADGSAEYAALVEDRMQGLGLGFGLTRALIEAARRRGVKHLHALVLPHNTPMLKLLRGLGLPEKTRWQDGAERVDIELSPMADGTQN